MNRKSIITLVTGMAVLALAPPAQAAPTTITGGKGNYEITAAPGTANDLTITSEVRQEGDANFTYTIHYLVISDSAGLATGLQGSCPGSTPTQTYQTLSCSSLIEGEDPADYSIRIDTGDLDDRAVVDLGPSLVEIGQRISGGDGNDDLFSDEGSRSFFGSIEGGAGNDRLKAGGGQSLKGQAGNDKLFAKNSVPNKVNCGPGKNSKERAVIDKKKDKAISC